MVKPLYVNKGMRFHLALKAKVFGLNSFSPSKALTGFSL
jgi:hypothetical protein